MRNGTPPAGCSCNPDTLQSLLQTVFAARGSDASDPFGDINSASSNRPGPTSSTGAHSPRLRSGRICPVAPHAGRRTAFALLGLATAQRRKATAQPRATKAEHRRASAFRCKFRTLRQRDAFMAMRSRGHHPPPPAHASRHPVSFEVGRLSLRLPGLLPPWQVKWTGQHAGRGP